MAKELAPRPYIAVEASYGSFEGELKVPYKTWLQTHSKGTNPEVLKGAQGHIIHKLLGNRARNAWIDFDQIAFDREHRLIWGNYQTTTQIINGKPVKTKKFIEKDPPYKTTDSQRGVEPPVLDIEKMRIARQTPEKPEQNTPPTQDTLFDTAEFEPVDQYSGAGHYRLD